MMNVPNLFTRLSVTSGKIIYYMQTSGELNGSIQRILKDNFVFLFLFY